MTPHSLGQGAASFQIKDVVAVSSGTVRAGKRTEVISVGLLPEGLCYPMAWGDCPAGPNNGQGVNAPVFRPARGLATIAQVVAPLLRGREVRRFRDADAWLETVCETVDEEQPLPVADLSRRTLLTAPWRMLKGGQGGASGPVGRVSVTRPLHPALRFGLDQALLQAVAWTRGRTMAEVIADEWNMAPPQRAISLHGRPGTDRQASLDAMIEWRLASLPNARLGEIPEQPAQGCAQLTHAIRRLRERITALEVEEYRPVLHFDLQGALGTLCKNEPGKMLGHLYGWEMAARPCGLRIEDPILLSSRGDQIRALHTLRDYVRARRMAVQLVAGAWVETLDDVRAFLEADAADCVRIDLPVLGSLSNSVEAVLACREHGVDAILDCSDAGTGLSARAALHVALGCGVGLLTGGPDTGIEGVAMAQAELARTLREAALHGEWSRGHNLGGGDYNDSE